MPGLLVPADDVRGAIVEFLKDHRINSVVMTEYDDPPVYIQRFQTLIFLRDQQLLVRKIVDECHSAEEQQLVTIINLADSDSLDRLVTLVRQQ